VLDYYLDALSNKATYPLLDTVVFVGHGAGAQAVQRYAVIGKDPSRASLKVRYVVANPSTSLYFTIDRPEPVDTTVCDYFNDFRYGLENYESPYPKTLSDVALFKRYLSRDVRYLVGQSDTRSDEGDQNCAALAAGGVHRRDRNLNYWAYLHLLSGASNVPDYPGLFPALDASGASTKNTSSTETGTGTTMYSVSSAKTQKKFKTNVFNHQMTMVPGVGHSPTGMLRSSQGLNAIFGQ
jgi:pimeloyl-ACP methyl ester carboxylesterase